jgi:hypothetical protein
VSALLPEGFVTLREAADMIVRGKYAGVPDSKLVAELRRSGADVADGAAIDDAIAEIWDAVDAARVRALVIGGQKRKIIRLPITATHEIPALRSPRGRDFTFLRPRDPLYKQLTAWLGLDLADVKLVFRAREIEKLARTVLRRRRDAAGAKTRAGRPSHLTVVATAISEIIASRKWSTERSLKALTAQVNRRSSMDRIVSEDTVTRALDRLFKETGDRRFQRLTRKRV